MSRLDTMESDYREAKNHIYGLAHNVCIDGKEQKSLLSALHEAEMEMLGNGENGLKIIKDLLSIISSILD